MPNGGQLGSFENVLEFPCLSAAPRAVQKSARAVLWPAYGRAGEDMLCHWNPAGPRRKSALVSTFLWLAELTTKTKGFKGFSRICRIIGERCQHFTIDPMICTYAHICAYVHMCICMYICTYHCGSGKVHCFFTASCAPLGSGSCVFMITVPVRPLVLLELRGTASVVR